jgi:hypothetical protein
MEACTPNRDRQKSHRIVKAFLREYFTWRNAKNSQAYAYIENLTSPSV